MNDFNRIPLTELHNTRDLGGLSTMDERKIQRCCCIQSGELSPMTEEDKNTFEGIRIAGSHRPPDGD